ncbi:hypothetical protein MCOR31_010879, partial [Pyricularia oryzae]
MQSHSERQSPSSQDIRQHGFSSKSKIALDDCTQAKDLGERRRIENSVLQRNYRRKITERNDLGLHNLKYARIQSSTGSFPAGPRRSFTTQDSHITHPKAATDAFQVAITGSQIEAETLPCPQSTSLVAQQ